MRFTTLNEWLDWQQTLHWQEIELGLNRIKQVAAKLNVAKIAQHTIIVAGTNGKGSTVAYYASFLQAAGYSVGCYTSPHLQYYNERISINGIAESDEQIMQAFEQIDHARGEISLSYFEFGTLAALLCIKQANVDVAILEVGLGGRLDAVNIIDADLVHFTSIGIDHIALLGDTREKIAIEKAGVLRQNCSVVCNDELPPQNLIDAIQAQASKALYMSKDFYFDKETCDYKQASNKMNLSSLALKGHHQKLNCCGVLAGLGLLNEGKFYQHDDIKSALNTISLKGRYETIKQERNYKIIIDVGHNADAGKVLAQQLIAEQPKNCVLILGMLGDKEVKKFSDELSVIVDHCVCVDIDADRALSADELNVKIKTSKMTKETSNTMSQALSKAKAYVSNQMNLNQSVNEKNIILVTGSFYTVDAFLTSIKTS